MNEFLRELGYVAIALLKMLLWTTLTIICIGIAAASACWATLTQDDRFMGFTVLGVLLALKFIINMFKVK